MLFHFFYVISPWHHLQQKHMSTSRHWPPGEGHSLQWWNPFIFGFCIFVGRVSTRFSAQMNFFRKIFGLIFEAKVAMQKIAMFGISMLKNMYRRCFFVGWNKFVVDQRFEMFFMFHFLGTRGTRGYHGFGSSIFLFHFLTIDPSNTSKQFPFKHGKYTRKILVPGNVMGSLYAVMLHGNFCCG